MTLFRSADFKSAASTDFAIRAGCRGMLAVVDLAHGVALRHDRSDGSVTGDHCVIKCGDSAVCQASPRGTIDCSMVSYEEMFRIWRGRTGSTIMKISAHGNDAYVTTNSTYGRDVHKQGNNTQPAGQFHGSRQIAGKLQLFGGKRSAGVNDAFITTSSAYGLLAFSGGNQTKIARLSRHPASVTPKVHSNADNQLNGLVRNIRKSMRTEPAGNFLDSRKRVGAGVTSMAKLIAHAYVKTTAKHQPLRLRGEQQPFAQPYRAGRVSTSSKVGSVRNASDSGVLQPIRGADSKALGTDGEGRAATPRVSRFGNASKLARHGA